MGGRDGVREADFVPLARCELRIHFGEVTRSYAQKTANEGANTEAKALSQDKPASKSSPPPDADDARVRAVPLRVHEESE